MRTEWNPFEVTDVNSLISKPSHLPMIVSRAPALRHTIGGITPYLRGSQRRWAQVHDVRFLVTHGNSDGVLEKYKEKLDRKAKEYGAH